MRTFTLKGLFLTTVFMLLGCLAIHAADDGLITEQVVVKLDEAGTLSDKISESDKYRITNLKIIGEINGTDQRLIREMTGCVNFGEASNGKLAILDLSDAKIVKGGDYYYYNATYKFQYCYTSDDAIGDGAFVECVSLVNITLPSSITRIGDHAFEGCGNLNNINLPSGITWIGEDAFRSCSSLTSINLPLGIRIINGGIFAGCCSLTSINIPAGVTEIGDYAFDWCPCLTSIDIPSGVTKIGKGAFRGCI